MKTSGPKKNKLQRIIEGWQYLVITDPVREEKILERVKFCSECVFNKANFCKLCGCFIPAKVRSLEEKCKLNKWKEIK